jgi:hypothetical protein
MHTRITISVIIVIIITIIIIVVVVVVLIYTPGFRDAESRNRICVNGTIGATAPSRGPSCGGNDKTLHFIIIIRIIIIIIIVVVVAIAVIIIFHTSVRDNN